MMFGKKEQESTNIRNIDKVDTIIGKGTEIKGSVEGTGVIRVDGKIEGDIHTSGDVIVGETGKVYADIKARHVTAAGEVHGNIQAQGKLEIIAKGKVYGDIQVSSLVINDGAIFEGKSEMIKEDSSGPKEFNLNFTENEEEEAKN
jgi:cytoskeletal protein CcmA (bactofilin family)